MHSVSGYKCCFLFPFPQVSGFKSQSYILLHPLFTPPSTQSQSNQKPTQTEGHIHCLDDCVCACVCVIELIDHPSIHLSTNLCLYQCMLISIRACICTILVGCQHINIYMDTWMYASLGLLDHHIFVILDSPALLSKLCATQGRKES